MRLFYIQQMPYLEIWYEYNKLFYCYFNLFPTSFHTSPQHILFHNIFSSISHPWSVTYTIITISFGIFIYSTIFRFSFVKLIFKKSPFLLKSGLLRIFVVYFGRTKRLWYRVYSNKRPGGKPKGSLHSPLRRRASVCSFLTNSQIILGNQP